MPVGVNGPMQGLSEAEAEAGLKQDGPNQLPHAGTRSIFNILVSVVREPMYALLLGAGVVYVALGDPGEAALVFAFALVSVTITIVQEGRSERVLEALRDLASPRALVIREGNRKRIAGRDVVRGDLIVLAEGDRVPADAVLRASHDLHADELLLTGNRCRSARRRRKDRRWWRARAATICLWCSRARSWCAARALARSMRLGR